MHTRMISIGKRISLATSISFQAFSVKALSIDEQATYPSMRHNPGYCQAPSPRSGWAIALSGPAGSRLRLAVAPRRHFYQLEQQLGLKTPDFVAIPVDPQVPAGDTTACSASNPVDGFQEPEPCQPFSLTLLNGICGPHQTLRHDGCATWIQGFFDETSPLAKFPRHH